MAAARQPPSRRTEPLRLGVGRGPPRVRARWRGHNRDRAGPRGAAAVDALTSAGAERQRAYWGDAMPVVAWIPAAARVRARRSARQGCPGCPGAHRRAAASAGSARAAVRARCRSDRRGRRRRVLLGRRRTAFGPLIRPQTPRNVPSGRGGRLGGRVDPGSATVTAWDANSCDAGPCQHHRKSGRADVAVRAPGIRVHVYVVSTSRIHDVPISRTTGRNAGVPST